MIEFWRLSLLNRARKSIFEAFGANGGFRAKQARPAPPFPSTARRDHLGGRNRIAYALFESRESPERERLTNSSTKESARRIFCALGPIG